MVKDVQEKGINLPTNEEHRLLMLLVEEFGEASHEIFKILRFGFENKKPGCSKKNVKRLYNELTDVMAVLEQLYEIGSLDKIKVIDERKIYKKRIKIRRYMKYKGVSV